MRKERPRVLLVDDDQETLETLKVALELEEINVVGVALDGQGALDRLGEIRPDVVLIDLRMPGMDGIEATAKIKEQAPLTQVVILTQYEEADLIGSAEEVGAYAYLVKGCPPSLIRDVLTQAWMHRAGRESGPWPGQGD